MQTQSQPVNQKRGELFVSLLVLTVFLILAEISFSIKCSGVYFGDFKLISNHLAVPWRVVLPGILFFIFAQALVHLLLVVAVWSVSRLASSVLHLSWKKTELFGITLWCLAVFEVLFANYLQFPNSKFAFVLFDLLHPKIIIILFPILSIVLLVILGIALYGFILLVARSLTRVIVLIVLTLAVFIGYTFNNHKTPIVDAATVKQPNIIVIGIDSLRPDFLGFFGYAKHTPHLDRFLDHATAFSESMTPLARTYPSWVSILTGVYPRVNTVRTNLEDQRGLDLSQTLPNLLKKSGYETIFATDETRFSNIDQRYGFDHVVTPPIGFNDFLLGTFNDFPLSNLLVNTIVGKYLFPNSYGNRAVFITYNPDTYLKLIKPALSKSRTKPALFITHLCLPHYPYAWSALSVQHVKLNHYQASIARADQQFHDLMVMLKENKWLEHSIVVILSDHGEAVELPGDRLTDPHLFITKQQNKKTIPHFYPPTADHEKVNMSGGHGTDVLGLPQYHTLLAFKTFGLPPNQERVVPGMVSLMDIKPTLLSYLGLPLGHVSGDSLQAYIFGQGKYVDKQRDFFVESDFSPEAIRSVHPEERKVLFEGIDYFHIDPDTARITVRDNMLKMIISSKQYADYYNQWALALYPQNNKVMMPILVNLKTGQWTNDLTSDFAKQSPAQHMLSALKGYFGHDITTIENV